MDPPAGPEPVPLVWLLAVVVEAESPDVAGCVGDEAVALEIGPMPLVDDPVPAEPGEPLAAAATAEE